MLTHEILKWDYGTGNIKCDMRINNSVKFLMYKTLLWLTVLFQPTNNISLIIYWKA